MEPDKIKIKVIGIGNACLNICESLIDRQNANIEIYKIDMHKNKLNKTKITNKIILGTSLNGSGTRGGDPKLGAQAAEESSRKQISQIIDDCNMLIIVSGFGGGTGIKKVSETIAKLARNKNI